LGFGDGALGAAEGVAASGSSYERMVVSEGGRYVGRSRLGGGEGLGSGEDVLRRLGGIGTSLVEVTVQLEMGAVEELRRNLTSILQNS
jgi:hypothetical protein